MNNMTPIILKPTKYNDHYIAYIKENLAIGCVQGKTLDNALEELKISYRVLKAVEQNTNYTQIEEPIFNEPIVLEDSKLFLNYNNIIK